MEESREDDSEVGGLGGSSAMLKLLAVEPLTIEQVAEKTKSNQLTVR